MGLGFCSPYIFEGKLVLLLLSLGGIKLTTDMVKRCRCWGPAPLPLLPGHGCFFAAAHGGAPRSPLPRAAEGLRLQARLLIGKGLFQTLCVPLPS